MRALPLGLCLALWLTPALAEDPQPPAEPVRTGQDVFGRIAESLQSESCTPAAA